jgi:hypothetical protein
MEHKNVLYLFSLTGFRLVHVLKKLNLVKIDVLFFKIYNYYTWLQNSGRLNSINISRVTSVKRWVLLRINGAGRPRRLYRVTIIIFPPVNSRKEWRENLKK